MNIKVITFSLLLIGCPQPAIQPIVELDAGPSYDSSNPSSCDKACENLRKVNCLTGFGVDGGESCSLTCKHIKETNLILLDIACAEYAKTLNDAKLCKSWGC